MHLAAAGGGGSSFSLLIMLAAFIAIAYFFMIRPQRKRAADVQRMQSSIGPGDEIVTIGGLVGTVDSIDDNFVFLHVAPGVVTKYRRQAIAQVLTSAPDQPDEVDESDLGAGTPPGAGTPGATGTRGEDHQAADR